MSNAYCIIQHIASKGPQSSDCDYLNRWNRWNRWILDFAIIWISSSGVSLSLSRKDWVNLALSGPPEKDEVIQFNYLTESWDKNSQWCCLLLMFLILAIGINYAYDLGNVFVNNHSIFSQVIEPLDESVLVSSVFKCSPGLSIPAGNPGVPDM